MTGAIADEYGLKYKYQCSVRGCWKQKRECGYKELAMHNMVQHGVIEVVLAAQDKPELVRYKKNLPKIWN